LDSASRFAFQAVENLIREIREIRGQMPFLCILLFRGQSNAGGGKVQISVN
jgi:hypothetical protein